MPPCLDVYVWVPRCTPDVLRTFIDRHVDTADPGDERLRAFVRTHVVGEPHEGDAEALAELRPGDGSGDGFALYVRARALYGAVIAPTHDGAVVLGLSIDDPDGSPRTRETARRLLDGLRREFSAPAGIAGVELPPPRTRAEWEEEPVELRVGRVPPGPGHPAGPRSQGASGRDGA
ncbi:hypothetical protein [Streptomyces sp. VNUA24]|uniref:hypothetical protein n=1 Tax=Streptomyces sp. VNUA24 TaxID=3031131 RepID=UPI0023B7F4A7|nr:hypothetical protein [Streptomyces sp. VNUA24]WEH13593.1 hypothetical protein PYR72_07720 [Streptomyces sp. VNUA24]